MGVFKLNPVVCDVTIVINLYQNVKNVKEIKQTISSGTINATLIKADLVLDVFQLLVAANKAFYLNSQQKLKTRNVFSEILFALSPSNKITECFKLLGVGDDANDIIIVSLLEEQENINCLVEGDVTDLSELSAMCDKEAVIKLYNITEQELNTTSLLDCIVSQLASKDIR